MRLRYKHCPFCPVDFFCYDDIKTEERRDFFMIYIEKRGISDSAEALRRHIQENCTRNITLDDLAMVAHMNRTYVVDMFKAGTGFTPIDYLTLCRVERAKGLLRSSDDKLISLGRAVGFRSEVTFYRVFKRMTGMTPGEYRAAAT